MHQNMQQTLPRQSSAQHTDPESVLHTLALTKRYDSQTAVDAVSMHIRKGDVYGLIGENGAGKTTLIRLITGLSCADSGELEILGQSSPAGLLKARRRVGCIVEHPAFYESLTARQNLEYYCVQRGIPDRKCIDEALTLVNLTGTGAKKFLHFSLGMKQRLGLALAVLDTPDFVLLDEPVNGLDPTGILEMREAIKGLQARGISLMISSHILSELEHVATRYGFLRHGKLVRELSQEELREACRRALRIRVDDAPRAVAVLESVLQADEYKVLSAEELRLYAGLNDPAGITRRLVEAGVAVSALHEVGDTLEDYYAALMKEAF